MRLRGEIPLGKLTTAVAICPGYTIAVAPALAQSEAPVPPLEGGDVAPATESAAPAETDASDVNMLDAEQLAPLTAAAVAKRRKRALDLYDMGQSEEAFEKLDSLLKDCLESGDDPCDANTRGVLFRDAGVVVAGGMAKHAPAVRAFRRALREAPQIEVPNAYRTERVDAALAEAKEAEGLAEKPAEVVSSAEYYKAADANDPGHLGKHFLFQASGLWGIGPTIASVNSDGVGSGSAGAGTLGFGTRVLGAYVTNGGFAIGANTSFRHHFWETGFSFGTWGASGVLGGVIGRNHGTSFHYLLGGFGFELHPDYGRVGWELESEYGASLNGFAIGFDASVMQFAQNEQYYSAIEGR